MHLRNNFQPFVNFGGIDITIKSLTKLFLLKDLVKTMEPQFTLKVCGNAKRKNLSTKSDAAVSRKHTNAKN